MLRALALLAALAACTPADAPATCTPNCAGRHCGDDGCNGSCGSCDSPPTPLCVSGALRTFNAGACQSNGVCAFTHTDATCAHGCASGACVTASCTPKCAGKSCGDDGCGGSCGSCAHGSCSAGVCAAGCTPNCAGKSCGDDGCGGSCGMCDQPPAPTCSSDGASALTSGGGACVTGACTYATSTTSCAHGCSSGICVSCTPACGSNDCGGDGCGGSCGACAGGTCSSGFCVCLDATTKCGGSCVPCASDQTKSVYGCTAAGACVAIDCVPGWHLAGGVCVPWAVELVDPAGVVGDEDGFLRVDATGTPHLAYANATGLRYATRGAGGWTSELVTPTHASAQLVLDASGGPHLAWAASFAAMYADKASGAWKTSTVEANDVDCDVSLALDASGATLVAYHVLTTNVANTVLHLASGAAGATAWTVETIPNGGPGCYVREAVDSAGALHVLHVSISEMDHLVKSSGSWTLHALSFSSEASEFSGPSFTLPAGGGYGVAYVDNVLDDLQYTYPSGSAQYPVATSTVLDGRYQSPTGGKSLAFDSKGTPWLAYGAGTSLVLARYDGTNWHANPIEDTHDFYFGGVSLVLDANDAPHLAWYTKDGLKYAQ